MQFIFSEAGPVLGFAHTPYGSGAKVVVSHRFKLASVVCMLDTDGWACLAHVYSCVNVSELDQLDSNEEIEHGWYSAPEAMLACKECSPAVDIWAVGCIFGEMMKGKAMFSGSDYQERLRLIVKCIGR